MSPLHITILILSVLCALALAEPSGAPPGPSVDALSQLALVAYATYCPFEPVIHWDCYWCRDPLTPHLTFINVAYNNISDTFVVVGLNKAQNTIEVQFRGTVASSIKNWLTDFFNDLEPAWPDEPGVMVHGGFYFSWESIQKDAFIAVENVRRFCPDCTLNFGGHSLGAALATVAVVDYARLKRFNLTLTTFGSPRIGNSGFSWYYKQLKIKTIRVVNRNDIVPHYPLDFMSDYTHVPQEFWYLSKTDIITCSPNVGEDPNCSASLKFPHSWSIPDHGNYMDIDSRLGACSGNENPAPSGVFNATHLPRRPRTAS